MSCHHMCWTSLNKVLNSFNFFKVTKISGFTTLKREKGKTGMIKNCIKEIASKATHIFRRREQCRLFYFVLEPSKQLDSRLRCCQNTRQVLHTKLETILCLFTNKPFLLFDKYVLHK